MTYLYCTFAAAEDFLLQRHTRVVENTYHQLGGLITVIVKEGHAHHPHSLQNAKPIADWIEQHMTPSTANRPAFVDATFTKGYYYSLEPSFIYLKEEDTYATARGPGFTECYDRYDGPTSGKFRTGGMSIIVPKTVAPGKPWVFTGDPIERDATVEQALLAKGYHILIVSPLGSGMTQKQWDDAYKLLVDNGFSNKPVLKGTGPKAGEAYAWAVANPDKVSCIYARNPLMKSLMAGKEQPIDNLAALAKAGVPVLHDCGALDPWLDNQTRVVEKRYKELGGKITVIVRAGEGHFPLSPKDPKSVVDFIIKNAPIPVKGDEISRVKWRRSRAGSAWRREPSRSRLASRTRQSDGCARVSQSGADSRRRQRGNRGKATGIHSATHLKGAFWEKWIEIVLWRFRPRLSKLFRSPSAGAWLTRLATARDADTTCAV